MSILFGFPRTVKFVVHFLAMGPVQVWMEKRRYRVGVRGRSNPNQIQTIQEFAKKVIENLEAMDDDFEMKRRLVEELDVNATLVVENGEKVIYARCWLGEGIFLTTCSFHSAGHKANLNVTLVTRLVLDSTRSKRTT